MDYFQPNYTHSICFLSARSMYLHKTLSRVFPRTNMHTHTHTHTHIHTHTHTHTASTQQEHPHTPITHTRARGGRGGAHAHAHAHTPTAQTYIYQAQCWFTERPAMACCQVCDCAWVCFLRIDKKHNKQDNNDTRRQLASWGEGG